MSNIHLNKELRDFLTFEIKNVLLFLEDHENSQKERLKTFDNLVDKAMVSTTLEGLKLTNKKKGLALTVLSKIKKVDEKELNGN